MANPQQASADESMDARSVADQANTSHLEAEMADKLTKVYWDRRVQYQLDYYQKRAREYELNVDSAFRMGAILMTISSLLASLGVVVSGNEIWAPLISLLTAIIPAIVSYIAAFRQLYQWDRQLSLYRDTQLNLERAKLSVPDLNSITKEEAPTHFPTLVKAVEDVLQQEISQWGQIARGEGDEEGDAERDLDDTLRVFLTSADGDVDEEQLEQLKSMVKNAKDTPRAGQYRQTADELETDSALLGDEFYDAKQRRERIRAQQQEVEKLANNTSQRTPTVQRPELVGAQPADYDVDELGGSGDEIEDEPDEPAPATSPTDTASAIDNTMVSEPADLTPDAPASTVDMNTETVETGMNVVIDSDMDGIEPAPATVDETSEVIIEDAVDTDDADVPTMESPIVMPDSTSDAPDLRDIDALQDTSSDTEMTVEEEVPASVDDVPPAEVASVPEPDLIDDDEFEAQFPASDVVDSADDFDDDLSDDAFVVDDYDIVDWSSDDDSVTDDSSGSVDDNDDDTYADIEEIDDY